ncbi:MAG: tetratricopeptide repeat protein [Pseudomonadota bacterium]
MATKDFKRKLSAILSADVAGYSRLMGEDEAATVSTLEIYREVMSTLIKQHRGRVVDSPGDNVLAEFASVVDAVQCGVAVQNELQARNAELPENRRMQFRIGINLGDVIEEGDRIYGDGVNITARLEALADPGGICISKTAFDHIETKLPLGYEYLGDQTVKNITKPVGAYRVLMEPRVTVAGEKEKEKTVPVWRRKAILAGGAVLVLAVIAVGIWNFYFRPPPMEVASVEKMAFPLPDKPSIAVLPFTNLSGDTSQDFLVDGITENIITALSATPQLFVIARNSTFTYKGKAVKVQQVSEELGVHYVLKGSVARSGDRIRVTAQLIDALKGHHLWAERYDRELKDLFILQDDLTKKILTGIGLKLTRGEEALHGSYPKSLDVHLKTLRGGEYLRAFNIDDNNRAQLIAEECIALEPDYWGNYVLLGSVHMMDYYLGSTKDPAKSLQIAIEHLEKAASLTDDAKGRVYPVLGNLYAIKKDYDKAIELGEKAIAMIPNGADAHAWLAMSLTFAGRAQEALPLFEKAMRLNPLPPAFYYLNFGHAHRLLGRFEEAVSMYKKTIALTPNNIFAHLGLAGACGIMGKEEEAKAAAAEVLRINPKFSIEYFAKVSIAYDKELFFEGLRKAGLPEKPPLRLPDKPSIAVLPFVNMSDDPKQEYFSDGLTEEIINALSKVSKLFVIARNSTFTYKGKPVKVQQVGRELGVRYVLEGSVRKAEDRVRITAQLIDATTGHHLWSERYDRDLKDIFALQDEITMKIISAMQVELTEGEQAQMAAGGTANLDVYLKVLEARDLARHQNIEDNLKARQILKEARA